MEKDGPKNNESNVVDIFTRRRMNLEESDRYLILGDMEDAEFYALINDEDRQYAKDARKIYAATIKTKKLPIYLSNPMAIEPIRTNVDTPNKVEVSGDQLFINIDPDHFYRFLGDYVGADIKLQKLISRFYVDTIFAFNCLTNDRNPLTEQIKKPASVAIKYREDRVQRISDDQDEVDEVFLWQLAAATALHTISQEGTVQRQLLELHSEAYGDKVWSDVEQKTRAKGLPRLLGGLVIRLGLDFTEDISSQEKGLINPLSKEDMIKHAPFLKHLANR